MAQHRVQGIAEHWLFRAAGERGAKVVLGPRVVAHVQVQSAQVVVHLRIVGVGGERVQIHRHRVASGRPAGDLRYRAYAHRGDVAAIQRQGAVCPASGRGHVPLVVGDQGELAPGIGVQAAALDQRGQWPFRLLLCPATTQRDDEDPVQPGVVGCEAQGLLEPGTRGAKIPSPELGLTRGAIASRVVRPAADRPRGEDRGPSVLPGLRASRRLLQEGGERVAPADHAGFFGNHASCVVKCSPIRSRSSMPDTSM